jgi:hypothetical protein
MGRKPIEFSIVFIFIFINSSLSHIMSDYLPSESQVVWDISTPANSSFEIPDSQDGFEELPPTQPIPSQDESIPSTQLVSDSQHPTPLHPTQVLQLCQAHAESWGHSGLSTVDWESCQFCVGSQSSAEAIGMSQPSTESLDEPQTPKKAIELTRDDRIRCQTLASIGWKAKQIVKHYNNNWTIHQVYYAC